MAKGKRGKKEKKTGQQPGSRINPPKADKESGKARPVIEARPETREHGAGVAAAAASAAAPAASGPRKVSLATCAGCMFLALVLGLYLGTLLPGVIDREKAPVAVAPAPQPAETPAPAPGMDPQLKNILADLEKNAAAKPDSAPDWINLGNAYFDAGMPREAIQAYGHALELAPRNADVLTDLGIMYRETGEYGKAVESFRKAVEIDPGHQNAMFNEGVVLANDLHDKAEAARVWGRLLRINPNAQAPNGAPLADMIKGLQ